MALLTELANSGHDVVVCAPGEDAAVVKSLNSIGVVFQRISLNRTGINPLGELRAILELVLLFRKIRPDIVLNYTIKPVIYGSLAARLSCVPHVYSMITGLGYVFMGDSFKQRIIRALVSLVYKQVLSVNSCLFFLNSDDLKYFVGMGFVNGTQKTMLINGEGIDLGYYAKKPLPAEKTTFLLIARLIKDKGVLEYVQAATNLKKLYPDTVFSLLGPYDSNPTALREAQVKEWQRTGVIEYLGETTDVRPYISAANVYVLPSYREGLPLTVLEAMSMGRPVITTDAPGCRETVIDGDNGFLVPVGNADSLAVAMERFILQPELIEKMGRRSREIVEEKYDVNKVNSVIINTMGLNSEKNF